MFCWIVQKYITGWNEQTFFFFFFPVYCFHFVSAENALKWMCEVQFEFIIKCELVFKDLEDLFLPFQMVPAQTSSVESCVRALI
jgi:hypothetical protein